MLHNTTYVIFRLLDPPAVSSVIENQKIIRIERSLGWFFLNFSFFLRNRASLWNFFIYREAT